MQADGPAVLVPHQFSLLVPIEDGQSNESNEKRKDEVRRLDAKCLSRPSPTVVAANHDQTRLHRRQQFFKHAYFLTTAGIG